MSTDDTNKLTELLADGPIAAVHFHTGAVQSLGGSSRHTRAFVLELANVLAAASPKKPIICTSDHALTAIFRLFGTTELRNRYGQALKLDVRFADLDGMPAQLTFTAQFASKDQNTVAFPDAGKWLDGRTPLTVARHELPVYDATVHSAAVEALVERWQSAGKIVEIERPYAPPRPSAIEPIRGDEPTEPTRLDRLTPGERAVFEYEAREAAADAERDARRAARR